MPQTAIYLVIGKGFGSPAPARLNMALDGPERKVVDFQPVLLVRVLRRRRRPSKPAHEREGKRPWPVGAAYRDVRAAYAKLRCAEHEESW